MNKRNIEVRSEVVRSNAPLAMKLMDCGHARPRLAWFKHIASGMLATAVVCAPSPTRAAALSDGTNGTWYGRGRVTFEGTNSEELTCRAYYTRDGSVLSVAIRCASASYKTEIRSKLHLSNEALAGEGAAQLQCNQICIRHFFQQ